MNRCGKCKEVKNESEFRKQKKSKTGLQNYCRTCQEDYNREYRRRHSPVFKERWRKQHQTPKGRFNSYRNNAKSRGRIFTLSFDQFMTFWQQPCFYCKSSIETIGLDRIDNVIGYQFDNVVSCCEVCNSMKSELTQEEFLLHCIKIIENQKVLI